MGAQQIHGVKLSGGRHIPVFKQGTVTNTSFTSGAAGTMASAVNSELVQLSCTVDAFVHASEDGTAATNANGFALKAGVVKAYKCVPNSTKFSALGQTQSGTLSVEEVDR